MASPPDFLSALAYAMDISRRPNGTVDRALLTQYDIKNSPNSSEPFNGVKSSDIIVNTSRDVWFRLYTPTTINNDTSSCLPVLIYCHGGGFAYMDADSKPYDDLCQRLARELPAVVISVNYGLSPEHRYPSHYEDGFDALKFIDSNNIEGFPPYANLKQCFIAGDSAGANLAHHVSLRAVQHEFRRVQVIGLIALEPFFGGEKRTESELKVNCPLIMIEKTDWFWKSFLPEGENRDHRVVNVFGPNAFDISSVNFPATLVFIGGLDPLQDRGRMYHEGLKKAGKETYLIYYPNAKHAFYAIPDGTEAALMVKEVRDFMQKQSAKTSLKGAE